MTKKITFLILCLVASIAYAQDNGSVSPYSFFGVGELRSAKTVENEIMGGIAIYGDSIHVNLNNPAAYAKLGVQNGEDFGITVYTAGFSRRQLSLDTDALNESTSISNIDYLSIGLSLKKGLGIGFGITPLSSIGYSIVSETTTIDNDTITSVFDGAGGITRAYFSVGYQVLKDLSVGATVNFNFGQLENDRVQSIQNVAFATIDEKNSRVNGVDFNYALNYTPKLNDKYRLHSSVRVNTQANLTARNTQTVGSISTVNGSSIESINIDLNAIGLETTDLTIPTRTTLGLGFGEDFKWFIGAEYSWQGLSSFSNVFSDIETVAYEDANSIAVGGFYVPNRNSFSNYAKKITYRAGFRMENTGLVVNNTPIDNFGINFGVGLPLSGSLSNLNVGFELARKGTTDANLIQEDSFKINIGLSLNDLWFRKRKIN